MVVKMTALGLLTRNLIHFRWANLAVVAGMAVATAVLTGALLVGDSVRGSLEDLARRRLGPVDHALVAPRFFDESLAGRVTGASGFAERFDQCVGAIIVRGAARTDEPRWTAPGSQIGAMARWVDVGRGTCLVNEPLMEGPAASGGRITLTMAQVDAAPRDVIVARRSRQDTTLSMGPLAARAAPQGMPSLFSLQGGQRVPRNVWTNLAELQAALDQPGKVNVLLVSAKAAGEGHDGATALNKVLREAVELADYGLSVSSAGAAQAALTSASMYLSPAAQRGADEAARAVGASLTRVLTYLANRVEVVRDGGKSIHYAVTCGISDLPDGALRIDQCAINQWTADQLGAKVGDRIRLTYYQRQTNGELAELASDREGVGLAFTVARVLPMSGLGADTSLTPNYKGLTDAQTVREWNPPEGLKIDKKLVTDADEEYWKKHRAAPKVLLSLEAAQRLWGEAFGDVTSIRLPADKAKAFASALARRIDPAGMGMSFMPIKAQQLESARGGTDFAELFLGFSFFLIVAAGLLVAMLLRLSVEQRARQWGLLASLGFGPRALRGLALGEGMLLALIGGAVGLAGAIGYTSLMMYGLREWWTDAVGTKALYLHVNIPTLAMGLGGSVVVALVAGLWAIWRIGKTTPVALLSGSWNVRGVKHHGRGRIALWVAAGTGAAGLAMVGAGVAGAISSQMAFMGGGFLLLTALLAAAALWMRAPASRRLALVGALALERVGVRNASRNRARSLLTLGLVALASFILITVASMRQDRPTDTHERTSGAGGFGLILQADVPLLGDLGTALGRRILAITGPEDPHERGRFLAAMDRATFVSMRRWAGQDISCLNLTRPTQPTILGVPPALIERGGFAPRGQNPWKLLDAPADGDVPVIADGETAQYILKLSVGQTLSITDQNGVQRKLRLVATLPHSIFQSELLMSQANFTRLFPYVSGFGVVLVDASKADQDVLAARLATELEDYSVSVDRTADRLAAYQQVANTYLLTFQTLGALGLMLGTIGLAVVLLRSLVERRAELSLLAALGFSGGDRLRMVLAENVFLLAGGLVAGVVCAMVGVAPAVFVDRRPINLSQLTLWLGLSLAVGLASLTLTVLLGARHLRPGDLRAE
jgi:ABC-type antimicrobial peptide transport system permease subunit